MKIICPKVLIPASSRLPGLDYIPPGHASRTGKLNGITVSGLTFTSHLICTIRHCIQIVTLAVHADADTARYRIFQNIKISL